MTPRDIIAPAVAFTICIALGWLVEARRSARLQQGRRLSGVNPIRRKLNKSKRSNISKN